MKFKEVVKVNYRIRITSENIEEVATKAHETLPNNKVGDLAFTLYEYLGICSVLNKPYYLRKEKFLDGIEYEPDEYDEENGCLKDGVEFTEEELDEALMMLDKYKLIKIVSDEEINFGGR
jgi:hypothetical protein